MTAPRSRTARRETEHSGTLGACLEELVARWEVRRAEGARLKALVPLEAIAAEVLEELGRLATAENEIVTIGEAARLGGYSEDHLRREIAAGHIQNAGRKHKPAIRLADVPRKPGHSAPLPSSNGSDQLDARRRIVRDATTTPPRSA